MASAKKLELYFGPGTLQSAPSATNFVLNANNDQMEYIFPADEAATLTRLGFRYGVRAGTPPTFKISLQGVDTSGHPDGTIKGGGTPASKTFTPPADTTWNGTWRWLTLDNAYVCTRGEMLSIVIAYDSGTIDGSNNSSFTQTVAMFQGGCIYSIQNDAGSRTKGDTACFGYGSAGTAYGRPTETIFATNFTSASTPDERGIKFTFPADWCDTFKVSGFHWWGADTAGGSITCNLYDTNGTSVLQTVAHDADHSSSVTGTRWRRIMFDEATLSTLSAGGAYRLTLAPDANAITLHGNQVDAADDMEAWPMGANVIGTSQTDGGGFSDDATMRYGIGLILDDITEPTGGSGGFVIGGGCG